MVQRSLNGLWALGWRSFSRPDLRPTPLSQRLTSGSTAVALESTDPLIPSGCFLTVKCSNGVRGELWEQIRRDARVNGEAIRSFARNAVFDDPSLCEVSEAKA